jgi:hypothetical protein
VERGTGNRQVANGIENEKDTSDNWKREEEV